MSRYNHPCFMLTLVLLLLLSAMSCTYKKDKDINGTLREMMAQKIILSLDKMQCRYNGRDTIISDSIPSDFTIIVYVDSSECTPCVLGKIHYWNEFNKEAGKKKAVRYLFIMAPPSDSSDEFQQYIDDSNLDWPVYIDSSYVFRKDNPSIPTDMMYHVFMVDNEGQVKIVGDPTRRKSVKKLYLNILD